MLDFVARTVARLRADPGFSRNRHHAALSSPEGRRAMRIHRHLRSLERDIQAAQTASVERGGERIRIELRGRRSTRTAFLTPAEFKLLLTNPIVRAALETAAPEEG